jgi:hypothetical protein
MGFSLGWLATRNIDPQTLYLALQARRTGVMKPVFSSAAMAGPIPGGWHLVLMDRNDSLIGDALLADVSRTGEAVACFVEEHVMYSAAVGWHVGVKSWSIVHESEKGIMHLDMAGQPPEPFATIRAACEAEQHAEDAREPEVDHIFDIPVGLAQALTGFRHDAANMDVDLEVLEVARKSWWSRMFGRH